MNQKFTFMTFQNQSIYCKSTAFLLKYCIYELINICNLECRKKSYIYKFIN